MKIIIPAGSKLPKFKGKTIETKIKGTHVLLIGEQLPLKKWNIYIECREINERTLIIENTTTEVFNSLTRVSENNLLNFNYNNFLKKFLKKIKKIIN